MAQIVMRYWQVITTVVSLAVTSGVLVATLRLVERRLDRIDVQGSGVAQDALRRVAVAEQRQAELERTGQALAVTLGRIDVRTENIWERVRALEQTK